MKLTKDLIFANRTNKGGWTYAQMEALGVTIPPKNGWIESLHNTDISEEQFARFIEGRNIRAGKLRQMKRAALRSADFTSSRPTRNEVSARAEALRLFVKECADDRDDCVSPRMKSKARALLAALFTAPLSSVTENPIAERTPQDCCDCPNLKRANERISELQTQVAELRANQGEEVKLPWE